MNAPSVALGHFQWPTAHSSTHDSLHCRMATEQPSNLLSCPMCHIPFDTEAHEPKLLTCHHSFCLECLRILSEGRTVFRCPDNECRKKIQVPSKGIQELKTNFYISQMRSLLSPEVSGKPDIVCSHEDNASVSSTSPPEGGANACSKHLGQPLLFYCETCLAAICMNCTVLDHDRNAGHRITDLSGAVHVHRNILKGHYHRAEKREQENAER